MSEPVWVTREFVLVLHDRLLAEHGGEPGLRDGGLLESALAPNKLGATQDGLADQTMPMDRHRTSMCHPRAIRRHHVP